MRSIGLVPVAPVSGKVWGGIMTQLGSPCFGDLLYTCGVGRFDVGSSVVVSVGDILDWNMPEVFGVEPIV